MAEPASSQMTTPTASPSYFVRLGKLSAKVQERALQHSLSRARQARDSTYAAVAQITSTLDLLESARTSLGTASNQIGGASEQLLQRWTEWKQKQVGAGPTESEPDGTKDEAEVRAEAFGNWLQTRFFCLYFALFRVYIQVSHLKHSKTFGVLFESRIRLKKSLEHNKGWKQIKIPKI